MTSGLRIALVAPAYDCVPSVIDDPVGNGIRALADVLVARGHSVLVCAPLPSHSDARVVGTVMRGRDSDHVDHTLAHLTRALAAIARFKPDVTHDFSGLIGLFSQSQTQQSPLVVTVAEPLPVMRAEILRTIAEAGEINGSRATFVAQTTWVRRHISGLPWHATIEPAVSVRDVVFKATKQPFAAYIGPLTSQAGLLRVLQAATNLHLPLHISRRLARAEEDAYLANHLSTHLGDNVEIVQSSDAHSQRTLMANASVLITTSRARDRAPHAVMRSLASGTPVLIVTDSDETRDIEQPHPGIVWTSPIAELSPHTAQEICAADPYECRRFAAVNLGPETTAAAYETVYRFATTPSIVDLRTNVRT